MFHFSAVFSRVSGGISSALSLTFSRRKRVGAARPRAICSCRGNNSPPLKYLREFKKNTLHAGLYRSVKLSRKLLSGVCITRWRVVRKTCFRSVARNDRNLKFSLRAPLSFHLSAPYDSNDPLSWGILRPSAKAFSLIRLLFVSVFYWALDTRRKMFDVLLWKRKRW